MKILLARCIPIIALVAVAALTAGHPALASAEEGDAVTWSVRPSDGVAADGRSWVEAVTDTGQRIDEHMILTNYSDREVTFALYGADGYFSNAGRFSMLTTDEESTEAGTWIEIADTVSVPADTSVVVPFTIAVPADATPGDHPAGVAASITTTGKGTLGVESRVGFRVMLRVAGELATTLLPTVTRVDFTGSVNPFEGGTLTLDYTIANTGNTRVRVDPTLELAGMLGIGADAKALETITELAPGEKRPGTATFIGVPPAVIYTAELTATPSAVSADAPIADELVAAVATGSTAAFPWSQLVLLLAASALTIGFIADRRRTHRLLRHARLAAAEASAEPNR